MSATKPVTARVSPSDLARIESLRAAIALRAGVPLRLADALREVVDAGLRESERKYAAEIGLSKT